MSLPKEYTQVEYIQSSGTQYIDTGYKPNQNTRAVCKGCLEVVDTTCWLFGARYSASQDTFGFCTYKSKYYAYYNTTGKAFGTNLNTSGILEIDCNKETATLTANGITATVTAAGVTFACDYPLVLFACNTRGTISAGAGVIYSCQIYDNGTPVRDFVPCISADGTAGMYDTVDGKFYPNSGSGTFLTGPEVSYTPSAPSRFSAVSGVGSVFLEWTAVENADGYRIYRNGVLIAETAETSYTDTGAERYSDVRYTLAAVNEFGEGDAVSAEVFVKGSDRPLSDLITDRTAADVSMKTRKGAYNASDLNRVTAAAEYVHALLENLGYRTADQTGRQWFTNDIPDRSEMNAHHESVVGLDVIAYAHKKVDLPPSLTKLNYEGANNIEKFLLLCGEAAERIPEGYIYSDEIFGGDFT